MKINLITPQFFPAISYGGPVFSTLNMSRELAKLGNEILVSTTNANWDKRLDVDTEKKIEIEKNLNVKYYNDTILNRLSIPMIFGLYNDIKQADVVFLQYIFSISTPVALLYAKMLNKPVLLSPRGSLASWILRNGRRKKEWLNFLIRPFAKYIYWHATSEQEKGEILNLYPSSKVYTLPNCLPLQDYEINDILSKQEFVNKYLPNQEIDVPAYVIVSMGRLQAKKGFDILIDAFALVKRKFVNSVLLIAGNEENQQAKLTEQIKKLKLEKSAFLCGHISGQDKINFLANADLFALPSHNENFGNVYAESLASGTPVVASKNTPWEEIEKYQCGRWVENNATSTADAIMDILENGKQYYSENCKKFASRFSAESIGLGFHEIGKSLLKNKP